MELNEIVNELYRDSIPLFGTEYSPKGMVLPFHGLLASNMKKNWINKKRENVETESGAKSRTRKWG